MYKSRLQELCQRRSWNLPEYTTRKDGLDHIPRFKATCVVNGQKFETPAECKSSKDAQNTVARLAFDFFNTPTPPRLHPRPPSPSAGSAVIQPLIPASSPPPAAHVPEMQAVVPISPPPSSLPVPPPGLLAPNNSAHIKPVSNDMMQPNFGDTTQTSTVYRTSIGSNVSGTLHMYKNRLQQYTQKKNLSLPVYTCETEGPPHARRFKSRVSFDGKSYETVEFFPSLKEAEHAAAKVACLMVPVDQMHEEGGLYKNLLQELAQGRGLLCPTYETIISGPPHRPVFVSIVEIGSSTFRGDEAKTKKQAEMNAATTAYYALTEYSLITECSKASSSTDYVVSADLPQNILPIETIEKDEFVANEYVSDDLMQNILPIETMKSDAANEDEINAKRVKCSPANETTNLLALPLQDSPFEFSPGKVEHQAATDPVAEQPIEVQSKFCTKTVVFPRKSNLPIPEGASVMPYSDDQWVAYKVELNQEPNA